ncbi:MAG: hypothetical protein ACU83O_00395, partial [Gammaproteobacteria bacterium]
YYFCYVIIENYGAFFSARQAPTSHRQQGVRDRPFFQAIPVKLKVSGIFNGIEPRSIRRCRLITLSRAFGVFSTAITYF